MDRKLEARSGGGAVGAEPFEASAGDAPGMPPETPARFAPQPLDAFDASQSHSQARVEGLPPARGRRATVLGVTALIAGLATNEMREVLTVQRLTVIELVVLALFAINIAWVSLGVATALVGLVRTLGRHPAPPPTLSPAPLRTRTAVLLPTYNEDPARLAAGVEAMARSVAAEGAASAFAFFVLSDTTNAQVALAESEAVSRLRSRLGPGAPIYYRRRLHNVGRKPGNIRDFCERWGSAFDHLIPLDADSLLEGATLVELARRMESSPEVGLLQTLPLLHNGATLLARAQQYATRFYGPLLGAGFAWWTRNEGNYWGHNAIIRTSAFLSSAGLPTLSGKPPLGGAILSHDFVEAALLRRAGWSVQVVDDIGGSFEECPPSLEEVAVRDRRWCQGNLQHTLLLRAKGLHAVSRFHFLSGIMSYVASPLWLAFILATLALGIQVHLARPVYFPGLSLFPVWPRLDPQRAMRLFGATIGLLILPKLLGQIRGSPATRGALTRLPQHALSLLVELLLSAAVAPITMVNHCAAVAQVLAGRDSGWKPQRRRGDTEPWGRSLYRYRWHAVLGVVLAVAGWRISPDLLGWLSPAVLPLVLAAPIAQAVGSRSLGRAFCRAGLLATPEEQSPPPIARAVAALLPDYRRELDRTPDLAELAEHRLALARHLALVDAPPRPPRGQVDPVEAAASQKIAEARSIPEAVSFLTSAERALVVGTPALLRRMAALPHAAQSP